jgi:hypothetical protein
MTACTYARFCGKRMAQGDRANGCNDVDEQACDPVVSVRTPTPTAPAAPVEQPYRKCSNCYLRITKREWTAARGDLACRCGSFSWVEL